MTARPTLPQEETNNADILKRKDDLQKKRRSYNWSFAKPSPSLAPMQESDFLHDDHDILPGRENFNAKYQVQLAKKYQVLVANTLPGAFADLTARPQSLTDYAKYYPMIESMSYPPSFKDLLTIDDDAYFAEMRVAGCNPMLLEQVTDAASISAASAITDAHLQSVTADAAATLADYAAAGRLFACDYSVLEGREIGPAYQSGPRVVPRPYALFYTEDNAKKRLLPVAIVAYAGEAGGRVFTKDEAHPYDWAAAKYSVQVAEAVHHEMFSHLGRTHLVLEPFIVAAERALSVKHPILMLLRPHLRFLIGVNYDARNRLLAPDQQVDSIYGLSLAGAVDLAAHAFTTFDFEMHANPEAEMTARGVFDQEKLPHFPYRDDGVLLYDAIAKFTLSYANLYYPDDKMLAADAELMDWVREVTTDGKIKNLTPETGGAIKTAAQLGKVLAGIIWLSGPQHAAVNFPQWDLYGYMLHAPMSAYKEPPKAGEHWEAKDLIAFLPANKQIKDQIDLMFFLGTQHYDELGKYLPGHFWDPRPEAKAALKQFSEDLHLARAAILQRNQSRKFPYKVLLPENVPNSTSV